MACILKRLFLFLAFSHGIIIVLLPKVLHHFIPTRPFPFLHFASSAFLQIAEEPKEFFYFKCTYILLTVYSRIAKRVKIEIIRILRSCIQFISDRIRGYIVNISCALCNKHCRKKNVARHRRNVINMRRCEASARMLRTSSKYPSRPLWPELIKQPAIITLC